MAGGRFGAAIATLGSALLLGAGSCRSGHGASAGGSAGSVFDAGAGAHGGAGGTWAPGGNGGGGSGGEAAGGEAGGQGDAGTGGAGGQPGQGGSGGAVALRVMAANLTSGSAQSYDSGEGIRIFQGLRPDLVLIQEFSYGAGSTGDIRAFVDAAFGTSFVFARESGASLPNGVISRYPIVAAGVWDDPQVSNRELVWARVSLPNGNELWAVSVHLLTTSANDRSLEAAALVSRIEAEVPSGALLVLGGDLNTDSRFEGCVGALAGRFVTAGPYPADGDGNDDTNGSRTKPYDWVLASASLQPFATPVVIGAQSFDHGLVFDSRVYTPLSDVAPVLVTDSGATNMQHMAVVRDFVVP